MPLLRDIVIYRLYMNTHNASIGLAHAMPTLVKHVSVLLMIVRGGISVLNGAPEMVISMPHHFGKLSTIVKN